MKRAIIVLLIIAAIGAGGWVYYMAHSGPQIAVATAPITRADVIDAVASTGTLQPVISVTVGSQVSGNIAWLGADFNSIVKKNQVIAKLDPTLFEAAVAQAKAQVAQSEANHSNTKAQLIKDQANLAYQTVTYKRDTELSKRNLITADQLDQAKAVVDQATASIELDKAAIEQSEAAVSQAKAQLNQSQTNLEHSIITSPIDGIVTQRSVDIGQTVQASMTAPTLFVIAEDLTQMQVSANIDESDVGRITPGQDVTFRVDAFPGVDFHGTVAQIRLNPTVVNNVTTYATMLSVPNQDLRLKPGMTANLKIQVTKRSDVLRIPNTALRFRPSLDAFAALNEPVPPEALGGGRGRRGQGGQGGRRSGWPGRGRSESAWRIGRSARRQDRQRAGGQRSQRSRARRRQRQPGSAGARDGALQVHVARRAEAVHRADEGPRPGHGGVRGARRGQGRREEGASHRAERIRVHAEIRIAAVGRDHRLAVQAAPGRAIDRTCVGVRRSPAEACHHPARHHRRDIYRAGGRRPAGRVRSRDRHHWRGLGADHRGAAGNPLLGQQQNQRGGGPGGFGGGGGNRGGR